MLRSLTTCVTFACGIAGILPFSAYAQFNSVFSFPANIVEPVGAPLFSTAGNIYGVSYSGTGSPCVTGGGTACGTFFELTPPASPGGSWTETTLYTFKGGVDGTAPNASPIYVNGIFYGTTYGGGNSTIGSGRGTVYAMIPGSGNTVTHDVIYSFSGSADGLRPTVLVGMNNNLYGITNFGGTFSGGVDTGGANTAGSNASGNRTGDGTVFQLTPPAAGSGAGWTETIIHNFSLTSDGAYPQYIVAYNGALYVSCSNGGSGNGGTMVQLTPPVAPGGAWVENIIYPFGTADSASFNPEGFTFGTDGNIYGANEVGGGGPCRYYSLTGCGGIFKLTNQDRPITWQYSSLYTFEGASDSAAPYGAPTFDASGNLYVTSSGIANRPATDGAVLQLTQSAGAWTPNFVSSFTGANGDDPAGALVLNPVDGNWYGYTIHGGVNSTGTLYSVPVAAN